MKALVRSLMSALGYEIRGTRYTPRQLLDPLSIRPLTFDDVICRRMIEAGQALTFIQVGAFDGTTGDPLVKYISQYGWNGILIEPQAGAAARLRDLYRGNDRVAIVQAAIDATAGTRSFFTVNASAVPAWAGGLASFDRESILKHAPLVPRLAERIKEETVECVPFDAVIDTLAAPTLDLLQIDAEGADLHLLAGFPFHRLKPAILHWEIKHAAKAEREACFERLIGLGYRLAPSGTEDMIAVLF